MSQQKPPEITQEHIDMATRIAHGLAYESRLARMAGGDELASQALLALWELALAFDDSLGVPFRAYIGQQLKRRLVDWLRSEYGRMRPAGPSERLRFSMSTQPFAVDDETGRLLDIADARARVEAEVLAKDELYRLRTAVMGMQLVEQWGLLYPVIENGSDLAVEELGITRAQLGQQRSRIKRIAGKTLDRPIQVRGYRRRRAISSESTLARSNVND